MEITKELLSQIHERAEEYCIARYGLSPDYIEITGEDLCAHYITDDYGYRDDESYTITTSSLTEDLDEIRKKREEKEEIDRIKKEKERKRKKKLEESRQKRERAKMYQKLKEEFEKE